MGYGYAGLSAAMALGRALRKVLVIDSGKPCNRQTPHSHNLLTQDGQTPARLLAIAKEQVLQYRSVKLVHAKAVATSQTTSGFEVFIESNMSYAAAKLLFATGVSDRMPPINGFAECWGISVLHCPYCHGYEVNSAPLGIIANGDMAFELCRLISNWSNKLTLFTNGQSSLSAEQTKKITSHHIEIEEAEMDTLLHENGKMNGVRLKNGSILSMEAVFARPVVEQHCDLPQQLGCEITKEGIIKIDEFGRTSVPGIYAAGDNTTAFRALSAAIAAGTKSGAVINKDLIDERF
jgi:thioredoxin reductase